MGNQQLVKGLINVFFSREGRMSRSRFWAISIPLWAVYWLLHSTLEQLFGIGATNILTVLFLIAAIQLSAKRLHDLDRSAWWLLILFVPIIGLVWLFAELGFRKSRGGDNRYGEDPIESNYQYLTLP